MDYTTGKMMEEMNSKLDYIINWIISKESKKVVKEETKVKEEVKQKEKLKEYGLDDDDEI